MRYLLEQKDGDGWRKIAEGTSPTPMHKMIDNREDPENYRIRETEGLVDDGKEERF